MKNIAKILCMYGIALYLTSMHASAQENVKPDNTEVNIKDRNPTEQTADDASNSASDREIMQKIRKSIVEDKSLSTYAHNIKIISDQGKVTLRGPVKSDAELKNINDKAVKIVGQDNVHNELSVTRN